MTEQRIGTKIPSAIPSSFCRTTRFPPMVEFSIGRCQIRLHFLFLAALVIVLFTDLRAFTLISIAAAVIHEGGHLLMMALCGVPPKSVMIHAFGVVICEQTQVALSRHREVLISLAGPAANGIAAGISLLCHRWIPVESFVLTNGALGLFNLLPVDSLDGGRALWIWLSPVMEPSALSRLLTGLSLLCILPMATLGFWTLLTSPWNFSLLLVSVYLMLCLVLKERG